MEIDNKLEEALKRHAAAFDEYCDAQKKYSRARQVAFTCRAELGCDTCLIRRYYYCGKFDDAVKAERDVDIKERLFLKASEKLALEYRNFIKRKENK
ncbi:MAG: hypothetical protein LUB83_00125 [Prevotellaceae bacterium]|nr:hypothetical protein [Prevotellaceae bacterium]